MRQNWCQLIILAHPEAKQPDDYPECQLTESSIGSKSSLHGGDPPSFAGKNGGGGEDPRMDKTIKASSTTAPSSYSSLSSAYPSSISSVSPPRLSSATHLVSPPRRQHSSDRLKRQAREQLEGLIKKHGHPTIVCSSSSLRSLTSTSPPGRPSYLPSPELCPVTTTVDADDDTLGIDSAGTRPIPIPKAASTRELDDVPVTPLTGRFDEVHFLYAQQCPRRKDQKLSTKKRTRRPRVSSRVKSDHKMHSGGSTQLYAPATMAQSGRPLSSQNSSKGASGVPLSLPRFHPAVYQSSTGAHSTASRPSSPHQQRPQAYRMSSGSRDTLRQYRELITNGVLSRNAQGVITTKPAAPRLDPLGSPGPVTPLVLEEGDSYLSAGAANGSEQSGSMKTLAPSPELVEKLIQRENERIRLQKQRQELKGR